MTDTILGKFAISLLAAAISFAALAGTPGVARAAQITQTVHFSTSDTVTGTLFAVQQLVDADMGTANRFDPVLGTLDGVHIAISGTEATNATGNIPVMSFMCPPAPVPTPCPLAASLRYVALNVSFGLPAFNTNISFTDRAIPCPPYLCAVSLPTLDTDFTYDETLTGAALNSYIGLGAFGVSSSESGLLSLINFGPGVFTGDFEGMMTAAGAIQIVYDYTPPTPSTGVPEPTTFALFGLSLAGLGAVRRRKLNQSTAL